MELEALLKECCWLPYLEMYKIVYTGFGTCPIYNYYAAEILSLEKKYFFYEIEASNTASLHMIF